MSLRIADTDIEVKIHYIPFKEYQDHLGWKTIHAFQAGTPLEMDMPDGNIVRVPENDYVIIDKGRMRPSREDVFDAQYGELVEI